MKPFDLEQALQGKAVRLRGGHKGYIGIVVPDEYVEECDELHGIVADEKYKGSHFIWHLSGGYFFASEESQFDIIGMWEE